MKHSLNSYLVFLFVVFCNWGCTNHEFEEQIDSTNDINESLVASRSTGAIDYSKYVLLEEKTVMPRTGEFFTGYITYELYSYPILIYWDTDIEGLNLYGYIEGSNTDGFYTTYNLIHVSTYNSSSSKTRIDLIIKCNYAIDRKYSSVPEKRHVSFHVTFYPDTKALEYRILEEGEGFWLILDE